MPDAVTIIKQNPQREESWRYTGQVLKQTADAVLVQARFQPRGQRF